MLDVHPPHHAAHTWRDFFIHIATIVVGLFIAVGLEQTVEFFHHRHEVREIRKALAEERKENKRRFPLNVAMFRIAMAELQNNLHVLLYLRDHPGTPEEDLPGVLYWHISGSPPVEAVWQSAQQTQVLSYMPREEVEEYHRFYFIEDQTQQATKPMFDSMIQAGSFASIDPNPSHLGPAQLETEIDRTREAIKAVTNWGIYLVNIPHVAKDFGAPPTDEEIGVLFGDRSPEDARKLATPLEKTRQALAAARKQLADAEKADDQSQQK